MIKFKKKVFYFREKFGFFETKFETFYLKFRISKQIRIFTRIPI